ncbi:MAG: hypothetical protein ACYTGL_14875 [Planctomycetota bacterium]|jgi:hypothetical protein
MDQTRKQLEDQPKPATGIAGDMKRLHGDASATAAELREFVATLKGRSPAEVLGKIGESSLIQGIVQASIGCAVLLIVLTVVPYMMHGPAEASTTDPETTVADAAAESEAAAADAPATDASTTETEASGDAGSEVQQAAKAMGIDETRQADPEVNPLDKNLDSLLDGVE